MTGRFRVAMCTNNLCTGQRFDMEVPYELSDVSEKITELINNGVYYNFTAEYPYGPYQRFVCDTITVILCREA